MPDRIQRPIPITVIGWVFIILSSLSLIFYFGGYVYTHQLVQPHIRIERPTEAVLSGLPYVFFKYYWILSIIEIILSIVVLIVTYFFLELRTWARVTLEFISWFVFIYMILSGIVWVIILNNMEIPREMSTLPGDLLFLKLVFIPLFSTIVFALPILFIIIYLRSRGVKEAFN